MSSWARISLCHGLTSSCAIMSETVAQPPIIATQHNRIPPARIWVMLLFMIAENDYRVSSIAGTPAGLIVGSAVNMEGLPAVGLAGVWTPNSITMIKSSFLAEN